MNRRLVVLALITTMVLLGSGAALLRAEDKAADKGAATAPLGPHEERLYQLFERQLNLLTLILSAIVGVLAIVQVLLSLAEYRRQNSLRKQTDEFIKQNADQAERTAALMRQFMDQNSRQTEAMTTQTRDLITQSMRQAEQTAAQTAAQAREFMERTTRSYTDNLTHTNLIMQRMAELIGSMKNMTDLATQSQELALNVEKKLKETEAQKREALQELAEKVRTLAEGRDTRFNKRLQHDLADAVEEVNHTQFTYGASGAELPAVVHLVRGYHYSVIAGNYRRGDEEFGKVIADARSSPRQREIAHYNRGINRANLRQYDPALADFQEAGKLNPANLFYQFYLFDTALLKAREDGGDPGNLAVEFQKLIQEVRRAGDDALCEPLSRRGLLNRVLLSYASLLVFNTRKYGEAERLLQDPAVQEDLFAGYLALAAKKEKDPAAVLDADAVNLCLERAKAGHGSAIEQRSRLLRGLILQQCYRWSSNHENDLKALRPQLLADVAFLERAGGASLTVFSPLTQKNEPLQRIREQIG
jgi:F0F1-type ATP synthase membrane subunit b/b'